MIDLKGKVILVLEAVDEHHDVVLDATRAPGRCRPRGDL